MVGKNRCQFAPALVPTAFPKASSDSLPAGQEARNHCGIMPTKGSPKSGYPRALTAERQARGRIPPRSSPRGSGSRFWSAWDQTGTRPRPPRGNARRVGTNWTDSLQRPASPGLPCAWGGGRTNARRCPWQSCSAGWKASLEQLLKGTTTASCLRSYRRRAKSQRKSIPSPMGLTLQQQAIEHFDISSR
jgi:hypothetical protein